MRPPRFSIAVLLLAIAIAALVAGLFVEKRRYAALEKHARDIKQEFGHIDVADPAKIHLRMLKCDAFDTWQYRLYVPDDAGYLIEFHHNTGNPPIFGEQKPLKPDPGQHTITLQVAEDLLSPNDLSVHCFMISLDRRAGGISFPRASVRSLAGTTGRYDNTAHRLNDYRLHNAQVEIFEPGEVIDLLHITDQSESKQLINGQPAEIIIRLVPQPQAPPHRSVQSTE